MNDQIITGIFSLTDTQGYPLDMVLQELKDAGLKVDWKAFIKDAVNHEWGYETIFKTIYHACIDVYGPSFEKDKYLIPATFLIVMNKN